MKIKDLKKALVKQILNAKEVYIVGHNYIDLDAFGAIVGLSLIVKKFNKKVNVLICDKSLEPGVTKSIEKIKHINILNNLDNKNLSNSLLIIVDTNNKNLVCCNDRINEFKNVIVIDHHDKNKDTIKEDLLFIDHSYSSCCELVCELLRLFHIKLTAIESTIILSGIVLDTNNFILKANKRTFYNAYYLLSKGASTIEVQYLLKQDLKKFITRQKMLTNVKIINGTIAIARGVRNEEYRREDLAKIAETLLLFNKIESSFVIGFLNSEEVGISGRTLGDLNIGKIMEQIEGGGNATEGATKIKAENISEVEKKLIDILNN